jgi:hypothetical protein
MASITREIIVDAAAEEVWAAVGDFAAGPLRAAPGVFTDCRIDEPGVRTLTFADGTVVRERLIARDEHARRIVFAWIDDDVAHDNTAMQVVAEGETRSRLIWTHDTLPDKLAGWLATAMDQLAPVLQQALTAGPAVDAPGAKHMSHESDLRS